MKLDPPLIVGITGKMGLDMYDSLELRGMVEHGQSLYLPGRVHDELHKVYREHAVDTVLGEVSQSWTLVRYETDVHPVTGEETTRTVDAATREDAEDAWLVTEVPVLEATWGTP